MYTEYDYNDELYHHGVLGQKWGVRRYQNPDGTLTSEGRARITKLEKENNKLTDQITNTKQLSKASKHTKAASRLSRKAKNEWSVFLDKDQLIKKAKKEANKANRDIKSYKLREKRLENKLNKNEKELEKLKNIPENQNTLFISGSSKTQFKDSEYYRKQLPKEVRSYIDDWMSKNGKIVVGDAPGIDRQAQDYLKKNKYDRVEVYGPGKEVRYQADKKWKTNLVDVPNTEEGSSEWLAGKDRAMQDASTHGLAVVLENGGAAATRRNVDRLIEQNKDVKVYELYSEKKKDRWIK